VYTDRDCGFLVPTLCVCVCVCVVDLRCVLEMVYVLLCAFIIDEIVYHNFV